MRTVITMTVGAMLLVGASSVRPTSAATTATVPPAVPDAAPLALDVLASIPVMNEHGQGYDRDRFAGWLDEDGDGCATRAEVLIRDSLVPPVIDGVCAVISGQWLSAYDGVTVTDPAELQIDHSFP